MELFFPKIYKISLMEGPFSELISTNRKGLPNNINLIFLELMKRSIDFSKFSIVQLFKFSIIKIKSLINELKPSFSKLFFFV